MKKKLDPKRPAQSRLRTVNVIFIYEFVCVGCDGPLLSFAKVGWLPEAMIGCDDIAVDLKLKDNDRLDAAGCGVDFVRGYCDGFDPYTLDFRICFAATVLKFDVAEDAPAFVVAVMEENGWVLSPVSVDYEERWLLHRQDKCCEAEGHHVGPFFILPGDPVSEDKADGKEDYDEEPTCGDEDSQPPFSNN